MLKKLSVLKPNFEEADGLGTRPYLCRDIHKRFLVMKELEIERTKHKWILKLSAE